MAINNQKKSYLVLADGTVFNGYSMGKVGTTFGEVVFNTCMTSYNELLSDPTYYGQIVAQTYPLVANRGIEELDDDKIMASGYIVREWYDSVDDEQAITIDKYLKDKNIVGICGIDTRKLTRAIRDKGYINGAITDNIDDMDKLIQNIKSYTISGAVEAVTTKEIEEINVDDAKYNVVVVDYGFPENMLTPFMKRNCNLTVVPANTTSDDIIKFNPDGIILSDGPADPDDNPEYIKTIKELINKNIPIFAVGLGHQMIALAVDGKVEKMQRGHRGSNQPVLKVGTDKMMVTNQNHGYDIVDESIDDSIAQVFLRNANDNSIEGLKFKTSKAISVQFIPKDNDGYCDNSWIYDEFVDLMGG